MSNYPTYHPPVQPPPPQNKISAVAFTSLISGIISFFILPVIGGIVAIITGHIGLASAKRERESRGVALTGTILGYINVVGTIALIIVASILLPVAVDNARMSSDRSVESDVRATVTNIINAQQVGSETFTPVVTGERSGLVIVSSEGFQTGAYDDQNKFYTPQGAYAVCIFNSGGKKYEQAGFSFDSASGQYSIASDCWRQYFAHSSLKENPTSP